MCRVNSHLGLLPLCFLIGVTVLVASQNAFPEGSIVNNTDEAEEEKQLWLNATEAQPLESEAVEAVAPESEATNAGAPESEATNAGAPESEATEVMALESKANEDMVFEKSESVSTDAISTLTPPGYNISRTQALKEWGAHLLATKYMGSLAVMYLALCLFLALKRPMFTS